MKATLQAARRAGGHALLGAFDIGLELLWSNSQQPRRRTIRPYARLISPPEFVYELAEDGTMSVLGAPAEVALDAVSGRVVDALGPEWQTTHEILESLGDPKPSGEQVRLALKQAAKAGTVDRDPPVGHDAKGRTYRWRMAGSASAETEPPTTDGSVGSQVAESPLATSNETSNGFPGHRETEPPTEHPLVGGAVRAASGDPMLVAALETFAPSEPPAAEIPF